MSLTDGRWISRTWYWKISDSYLNSKRERRRSICTCCGNYHMLFGNCRAVTTECFIFYWFYIRIILNYTENIAIKTETLTKNSQKDSKKQQTKIHLFDSMFKTQLNIKWWGVSKFKTNNERSKKSLIAMLSFWFVHSNNLILWTTSNIFHLRHSHYLWLSPHT